MARPKLKIDPEKVRQLASIQCSYEEMATILGCDQSTLTNRFSQVIQEGRMNGRMSLKRSMFKKAVTDENTQMQIWLSKQFLGMSEKIQYEEPASRPEGDIYEFLRPKPKDNA